MAHLIKQANKEELSKGKIILWGIIIGIVVFLVSFYTVSDYMDFMIRKFARSKYIDDYLASGIGSELVFFLTFCVVSYYWNVISLRRIGRLTVANLIIQAVIDQGAIPIGIYIMVLHNNGLSGMPAVSSLLNPLAFAIVLLIKSVLLLVIGRRSQVGGK